MAFRRAAFASAIALCFLATVPAPAAAIVGGSPAAEGEYPWMAAITSGSGSSQYCGGSLVDSTTVVSAAHCIGGLLGIPVVDDLLSLVLSSPVYVLLGTNRLSSGGESIEVTEIFVHPEYDGDHDVAVLKLASPASQTPIGLVRPGQEALTAPGVVAWTAGWGATSEGGSGSDRLLEVALPLISDAQCAAYYGSSTDGATELCAGYPEGGKDTCQGDSGGPLMVPANGGLLLAGIVSWGDGCARPGVPGVYAEVAPLASFIESYMGGGDALRSSGGSAAAAPVNGPIPSLSSLGLPREGL